MSSKLGKDMPYSEAMYQMLFDYIQDDNKFKRELLDRIATIEKQTTLTNGKVIRNTEDISSLRTDITNIQAEILLIQQNRNTDVVVKKINWKWITAIGSILMIGVDIAVRLVTDWLSTLIKH